MPPPSGLQAPTRNAGSGKAQSSSSRLSPVVTLPKPVRHATLFATGQDTVSAWVNGAQVLTADRFPPWEQMPWKKFVRADVTASSARAPNTIAIETVHYVGNPDGHGAATTRRP